MYLAPAPARACDRTSGGSRPRPGARPRRPWPPPVPWTDGSTRRCSPSCTAAPPPARRAGSRPWSRTAAADRTARPPDGSRVGYRDADLDALALRWSEVSRRTADVARQLPAGDLGRRPPQVLCRADAVIARRSVGFAAHVRGVALGQQHSLQQRFVGLRVDRGARLGGDRLGRRVCLLAGKPALLDREARGVASRVHVRHTGDAAMPIHFEEALRVARKTLHSGPFELR